MNRSGSGQKTPVQQRILLVFGGILAAFLLLEAGLNIGGFVLGSVQELGNQERLRNFGTYRILCIGESTTQGQYPGYLQQALDRHGTGIQFSVIDKGLAGVITSRILEEMPQWLAMYRPRMVISMMGINDGAQHLPAEDPPAGVLSGILNRLKSYRLLRLVWWHCLEKYHLHEKCLEFQVAAHSDDASKYIELAQLRLASGDAASARVILEQGVRRAKNKGRLYERLAGIFLLEGQTYRAVACFMQAVATMPRTAGYYTEMGNFFQSLGDGPRAAAMFFSKGIIADPGYVVNYYKLAALYYNLNKLALAEDAALKGLKQLQKNIKFSSDSRGLSERPDKFAPVAESLGKGQEFLSERARVENRLVTLQRELDAHYFRVNECQQDLQSARAAVVNYQKLARLLKNRHIDLLVMQYPMRKVEDLRRVFGKDTNGIVFVDNEKVFKDAVARNGYRTYFRDAFAGDFGHCTQAGNRLLAANAAEAVLNTVLH